jgi:hypothetical protein
VLALRHCSFPSLRSHHAATLSISDLPILEDNHQISGVIAAIRAGDVTVGEDGHLRLPSHLEWPFATNNMLFVRKFYAPLLESVLNFCKRCAAGANKASQRRIVTGQPGIGKSVWM